MAAADIAEPKKAVPSVPKFHAESIGGLDRSHDEYGHESKKRKTGPDLTLSLFDKITGAATAAGQLPIGNRQATPSVWSCSSPPTPASPPPVELGITQKGLFKSSSGKAYDLAVVGLFHNRENVVVNQIKSKTALEMWPDADFHKEMETKSTEIMSTENVAHDLAVGSQHGQGSSGISADTEMREATSISENLMVFEDVKAATGTAELALPTQSTSLVEDTTMTSSTEQPGLISLDTLKIEDTANETSKECGPAPGMGFNAKDPEGKSIADVDTTKF